MSAYAHIKTTLEDGVVRIDLSRPHKRNALNEALLRELRIAVEDLCYRPEARVLVLSGEGSSFCSGADLSEPWTSDSSRARLLQLGIGRDTFAAIERAPVARIAQVNGPAVGGGVVLASCCELRYASETADVRLPEAPMGVPFSMGGLPRLVRLVGLTAAADWVLTGRTVPADEAHRVGFYTGVFPPYDLSDEVDRVARQLSQTPSLSLIESVNRLRESADQMLMASRDDLVAMWAAYEDGESSLKAAAYAYELTTSSAKESGSFR